MREWVQTCFYFCTDSICYSLHVGFIGRRNLSFNLGDVKTLIQEGIDRIDAKTWSDCCRHVRDREAEKWKSDIAVEQEIERIVKQIDSDSDVSSNEDDNVFKEKETIDTASESRRGGRNIFVITKKIRKKKITNKKS